jgi:Protein of unknown function DUF58
LKNSLPERVGHWISSKTERSERFTLSQKNIYIFPSAAGFGFLLLLLLMLLTAINYQNSLVYLLTFFLGAIFFISIWMCFLNLTGLIVAKGEAGGYFQGELAYYEIKLHKAGSGVYGLRVGLDEASAEFVAVRSDELTPHSVRVDKLTRGQHRLKRLRLSSTFPFGLIRAWTWLKLDAEVIIYPQPVKCDLSLSQVSGNHGAKSVHKSEEFNDFREYRQGDSFQRLNWKKYAASDVLVVREHDDLFLNPDWVRWQDYESSAKEQVLQYMCYQVCRLYQEDQVYGMELPNRRIDPANGERHYLACLTALAQY